MIILISYSAHFTGIRAESREANCCGGRLLHFSDFYIQLLLLHTNAIDETALLELRTLGVCTQLIFGF